MFKDKLLNISPCLRLFSVPKRLFHNKSDSIVIASAVRTPWGKFLGQLASVNAWQLGQMAVETAVKQSAVPLEDVKQIIMAERPFLQKKNDIFSDFLKKSKYIAFKSENEVAVTPLLKALDIVKSEPETAVVIGGMESATKQEILGHHLENSKSKIDLSANISYENIANYIACSKIKFSKALKEAIFEAELVPLNVQHQDGKRKIMREVKQDETCCDNNKEYHFPWQYSDGASALVLTTLSKARALNISPLAEIIDYKCLKNSETIVKTACQCIETLFAKSQIVINSIQHWEIDDYIPQLVVYLKHHFNLNMEIVNPHGSSVIMGYSPAVSLFRHLTHMAHALKSQQYGCLVSSTSQETLGLIIQKLPSLYYNDRLPLVTLYTRDPCLLCNALVEDLESNFSGEYELEKVFIDIKENVRYLRLYRWDIPVVFLNHQFLCMHRLNHKLLRQKLDLLIKQ